jgi:hypothetical protein
MVGRLLSSGVRDDAGKSKAARVMCCDVCEVFLSKRG